MHLHTAEQLERKHAASPRLSAADGPELHLGGHRFEIFTESPPLVSALVRDVRSARQRVWLECYIYLGDAAGRAVGDALVERAGAGVDVRLMYDAVGSSKTPDAFFERLRQGGVQVHAFNTLWQAFNHKSILKGLNRRNHRKLAIIDDRAAYFGGMNITDQRDVKSVEDLKARGMPASAGWRDVHVRMTGPRQAEVAEAFERLWEWVHGKRSVHWPRWPVRDMLTGSSEDFYLFDGRPGWHFRSPLRVFARLIGRAQQEITISMAYFLPVGRLLRALYRARRRGVRVRVVVPAQSDVKLVQWATRHLYRRLMRRGIEIYERQDQMLHSKVLVIDGRWAVIGSCNLDPRSMWLNLEYWAVFRSAAMADAVGRICEFEIGNSRQVTQDDCQRRWWWQCLLDRAAFALRRWL